jgi:penicillin amidase
MQRLQEAPFAPESAGALHGDTLSPHAKLFQSWLARLPITDDPAIAACREGLLRWDGHMAANSAGATVYAALRRAMTAILAQRSGLAAVATHPFATVPPGIAVLTQLWWALPKLLRDGDASLLGGWSWEQVVQAALVEVARIASKPWGDAHQPRLSHPLSAVFPNAAALLDPPSLPIGGDSDTVLATGILPSAGPAATYGALARYVFDVGNWEACQWSVFHGASGQPGSRHYADQNPAWSACEMVPMRYDWTAIAAAAAGVLLLHP